MFARQVFAVLIASATLAGVPALAEDARVSRPVRVPDGAADSSRSTPARPALLVKAGDKVRATVRVGGVEAVVVAIAEQSGVADQIIRVVNPDSRRAIRVRVVAAGEVEVVNVR